MSGMDTTLTVSTMLNGEYGIDDVCMSLLNVVGRNGAHSKVILPLTDYELSQLKNSASKIVKSDSHPSKLSGLLNSSIKDTLPFDSSLSYKLIGYIRS